MISKYQKHFEGRIITVESNRLLVFYAFSVCNLKTARIKLDTPNTEGDTTFTVQHGDTVIGNITVLKGESTGELTGLNEAMLMFDKLFLNLISLGQGSIKPPIAWQLEFEHDEIITKDDVGLGNVDNTSDITKPVSVAQGTALATKVPTTRTINSHPLSADVVVTKGDIGLGNVDNTADVDKPVSTAQASAAAGLLATAEAYADSLVVGLVDDRGNWNASGNTFPTTGGSGAAGAIKKGDLFTISVAGTPGSRLLSVGDAVRALVDTPGQTEANWAETENNFGYVAENSANKDASNGYAGLTLLKINFWNVLGTFKSFFTNANTAARTYTFQDRNGTVADDTDITGAKARASHTGTQTASTISDFNAAALAAAPAETATTIGALTHGTTPKTTLVDADELGLIDSAASNVWKRITWANVKAVLKTYFDTFYQPTLVSGTNIKTLNTFSLLEPGNITIATLNNGASANVIPKSDGTNLVASRMVDAGTGMQIGDATVTADIGLTTDTSNIQINGSTASQPRQIIIDSTNGQTAIGDVLGTNNSTELIVDDNDNALRFIGSLISLGADNGPQGFFAQSQQTVIGDVTSVVNGTKIAVDDAAETVSIGAVNGATLNGSPIHSAAVIHAATSKATPVNADELPIIDSEDSNVVKKLTWTNLKARLKAYFDTFYVTGSALYGDGNDGNLVYDGAATILGMAPSSNVYTLTRDIYANDLTVNSGVTLKCAGFRVFAKGTLTNNGTIQFNGNNAAGATAGANAGAIFISFIGGAGGTSVGASGAGGTSSFGGVGGNGGTGVAAGATAAATSFTTATEGGAIPRNPYPLLRRQNTSGSNIGGWSGGGGGASGGGDSAAATGGGGGAGGGVVFIAAKIVLNNAAGIIAANGGNGGNGATSGGNTGGGGGGGGGAVYIAYNSYTNTGTVSANGGTHGLKGNSGANGTDGSNGIVVLMNNNA